MENICTFTHRPIAFLLHYVRQRAVAHVVILVSVVAAVACSVGAQYGIKLLVDTLAAPNKVALGIWIAFGVLAILIAADNLLWRVAATSPAIPSPASPVMCAATCSAISPDIRRAISATASPAR